MTSFATIRARAEARKGGTEALARLLPPAPNKAALLALSDDRALAEMTRRIFCAGFVWSVIEKKWPAFEEAFLGFDPARLLFQPEEFWDGLMKDTRIIRNGAKIMSVQENARFVQEIAKEYGSFGTMLANWPPSDEVGLLALLSARGNRLGGNSGQMLLRYLGYDGFVLSGDVVTCLRDAGVEIAPDAKSKRDLKNAQAQFNAWHDETGLPYLHLSRICAMSIGENIDADKLAAYVGADE